MFLENSIDESVVDKCLKAALSDLEQVLIVIWQNDHLVNWSATHKSGLTELGIRSDYLTT